MEILEKKSHVGIPTTISGGIQEGVPEYIIRKHLEVSQRECLDKFLTALLEEVPEEFVEEPQ